MYKVGDIVKHYNNNTEHRVIMVLENGTRLVLRDVLTENLTTSWTISMPIFKLKNEVPWELDPNVPTIVRKDTCNHANKYINHTLFQKFWVCPNCKKDLGNI